MCWDVHPHPVSSTVKHTLDVHAVLYMQKGIQITKACTVKYVNRS